MDGFIMKELDGIQEDMVVMEGMIEALINGAYNGAEAVNIGNSLEVLRYYIGDRAEKLDILLMNARKEAGGGMGNVLCMQKLPETYARA